MMTATSLAMAPKRKHASSTCSPSYHRLRIILRSSAMKRSLILFISFLILVGFGSCEKEYILRTNPAEAKVVIEGLVTDKPGYHYIKLSRSTDFYSSGKTPRITDATVTVTDSDGVITEFVHNPNNDPDSMGRSEEHTSELQSRENLVCRLLL